MTHAHGLSRILATAIVAANSLLMLAQAGTELRLSMDGVESVKQTGARAEGFAWFPAGVAGKAMGFDGIRTVVKVPAGKVPDLSGGFTVSAWVALEAYPWTMLAVVDQEAKEQVGYFLGLHPEGYPGLWLAVGNQWLECRSQTKLPLYEWNHLAGVWSPDTGMRLYVNGREVAAVKTSGRFAPAVEQEVWIGRNHTPRSLYSGVHLPDMAMQKPRPTPCSLDGLVDEVRIEAGALGASAVAARYQEQRPAAPRPLNPPRLPAGPDGPGEFGAVYTRLRYTDAWEHYWRVGAEPDVLVRFDRAPYRFVFWRGTSFVPCWVTGNGIWYANEFLETGENGKPSGAEPMADKQTRNSHVRIIESTPARVVVHWRYAPLYTDYSLAHVNPESGWGDWVDEYYTIYPDGVAVRKICVHSDYPHALPGSDPREGGFREYHESLVINPPGTAPQDNIKTNGLTLANMDGQTVTYSWEKGPPGKLDKTNRAYPEYLRNEKPSYKWRTWLADIPNPNIHLVNLKAPHSPFVIVPSEGAMVDSYTREIRPAYSIFPWWNHWPVTQIESGGRWAYATDRPSHSSLTHIYWAPCEQSEQGLTKIMLHGMTGGTAADLIPLAESWLHPPALQVLDGSATDTRYDRSQRAYLLSLDRSESQKILRLRLDCRPGHPAVNPALVVAGWGERPVKVSLNGREATQGRDFRSGFTKTIDGTDLILWLDRQATEPLAITLEVDPPQTETKEARDARMEWWREARFGMFVVFGPYSGLAGTWEGKPVATSGCMEWIQEMVKADTDTYAKAALPLLKPKPGAAREWAKLAKAAGCRYIVFTTKFGDGFAMFDSEVSDFDAGSVLQRDIVKEYVDACRAEGLRVGFYHSVIDWHHDQYEYRRSALLPHPLKGKPYPNGQRDHSKYVDYLHAQVDELISNYGQVDVLWFDYSAPEFQGQEAWRAFDLMRMIREKQPNIIINNRLFRSEEAGWNMQTGAGGSKLDTTYGDFITPEQYIPAAGMPGVDWETCMTMNTTWGYSDHDHAWNPPEALLRKLIDIAGKGGNFLLNIGPKGDGSIPQASIESMEVIGRWMKVNSEAIYGTSATAFGDEFGKPVQGKTGDGKETLVSSADDWRCTTKPGKIYLHLFKWPADGKFEVPGLQSKVTKAWLLAGCKELKVEQNAGGVTLALPAEAPDKIASVICLEIADPVAKVAVRK